MKSNDGKDLGDIGLVVASVPTDSVDAFIKWLADTGHPAFTHAETAPPQIGALKTRMMMNLASVVERDKTIDYLKDLVIPPNNFLLFDTAVEIIIKSKKIWPLNKKTLAFFSELYKKNSAVFDDLIESIGQLCEKNTLYLQADHIDTVIASLVKQKELPEASLAILERFLDRANPAIESITHTISTEHRPELTVTANQQQLIHHDIPHALEMKTRIMHVLCEKLNLLNTDSKRDRFLRNIISLMVEFHDYVQGKPPSEFKSVELSTAAQIVEWLTTSLPIAKEPDIKKIIEFMADQVIVLGTTMVYSPKQTTDLSQLFLMVEEAAVKAGDTVSDESNQKLIKLMKTAMLVTGVCDKNPSALSAVATMQYTNPSTATIPGIKHYFQEGLMLERFFSSKLFTSPPSGDISAAQLNQQRFLITLVPHLSMSAEVIKKSKPGPVTSYIDFIVSCRNKMLTCGSDAEFKEWYDKTLLEKNMPDVVDAMFFSIIESEVGFSRSQEGGLEFVSKKLQSLTPESDPLIDLTVPQQDIENFSALNMFYNGLDQAEKNSLIKEMLLVVVMQPGNIYAQQNELALKPPQSVFPRFKGGGFFSSDSAADTPKSGTPLKPR